VTRNIIVHWYRLDLRTEDLPALVAANRSNAKVLPVYILDDDAAGEWAPGGASRWWLHYSVDALQTAIERTGGKLLIERGDSASILQDICVRAGATTVHCTRRYEPWAGAQELAVHAALSKKSIALKRFPGQLLHEPGTVLTQNENPFKVFTPFWRACRRLPVSTPIEGFNSDWEKAEGGASLADLSLTPQSPNWAAGWETQWTPGELGARRRLQEFLEGPIGEYSEGRNLPAESFTSLLSPHLHHGELSPRQLWAICEQSKAHHPEWEDALTKFQTEVGWREFSYHLLHFFPAIPEKPFKENFGGFPWVHDETRLRAWQRGQTGYPIVDAGMRELWSTGYMHNRVRMVVASFLCKHLLIHWRHGENWFWDTLLDADLASNACSWQWVAGSGADASPYFRIFNPVTQGERFDKRGEYVRRWVPEIAALEDKYIHKPWEAPEQSLATAGIRLGEHYPAPLVDHRTARQQALDAYDIIRRSKAS
jgi:deoxyribodipyrimidine photo-lyase